MKPVGWPCPLPGAGVSNELALVFDSGGAQRLLVVPALFGEANRMRRLTVEVMRRLHAAGVDCVLPDLPGCNESTMPLEAVSPDDWRDAMTSAARHFGATHVLGVRGGGLFAPAHLPGWLHAPVSAEAQLRQMLRARVLASRERGIEEKSDTLLARARDAGIELSGHRLSADFIRQFAPLKPVSRPGLVTIGQDMLGGPGLWLRAEPGEDSGQADALAAVVALGLRA